MAAYDYTWLKATVASTLNKTNLTAAIPDFIRFGEDDISARLFNRRLERSISEDHSAGVIGVPNGFRDMLSISVASVPLIYMTNEAFDALIAGSTDAPSFYTISGVDILVKPTTAATLDIRYLVGLCNLSDSVKTDWLQCARPAARLYAALVHSAMYLRDDDRQSGWERMYEREMEAIEAMEPRKPVRLRADDLVDASPVGRYYG